MSLSHAGLTRLAPSDAGASIRPGLTRLLLQAHDFRFEPRQVPFPSSVARSDGGERRHDVPRLSHFDQSICNPALLFVDGCELGMADREIALPFCVAGVGGG
jgi:hypothetical protein